MKSGVVYEAKTHKYHLRYLEQLRWAARKNRLKETESEKFLWNEVLRQKKLGVKFTRQKPIDRFIIDFYCSELCLAIEVDGGYHQFQLGRDKDRDSFLKACGITTLRFGDKDILENIDKVKQEIANFILSSPVSSKPHLNPPLDRGGQQKKKNC